MPNQDEKNKVFYGVISQNSINSTALDDIYFGEHSEDLYYESWKKEISQAIRGALEDYVSGSNLERIVELVLDEAEYESNGEIDFNFNDGDYHIVKCLDSDLMILKSPYVTWAPPCSPCVPAAGDLDGAYKQTEIDYSDTKTTQEGNENVSPFYGDHSWRLAYCLGPDFFDEKETGKWVNCEFCEGTGLRNKKDIPDYDESRFHNLLFDDKRVKCWVCQDNEKYGMKGKVKEYKQQTPYPYAPIDENGVIGEWVFPD